MGCSHSDAFSDAVPQNPIQLQQYLQSKKQPTKKNRNKLKTQQKRIDKMKKKYLKRSKKGKNRKTVKQDGRDRSHSTNLAHQSVPYEMKKVQYDPRFIESKSRHQLDNDLCLFLINEISLTLQTFGSHYESEINDATALLSAKEQEINNSLDEHSVLLGNPADAVVHQWLQFQPTHGCQKNQQMPLQRPTMYIVFENIDVVQPNEANYDAISPNCKVEIESDYFKTTPTKEHFVQMMRGNKWKGYVRLKILENRANNPSGFATNQPDANHETYTDPSSGYSSASQASRRDDGSMVFTDASLEINANDDYDYGNDETGLKNPERLVVPHLPNSKLQLKDQEVLPQTCFSQLLQFMEAGNERDSDEDEDEDEEEDSDSDSASDFNSEHEDDSTKRSHQDARTMRAISKYKLEQERKLQQLQQRFLNSHEFMQFFQELMREKLAQKLQIAPRELTEALCTEAAIHTSHYHIIPALQISCNAQNWPDCAFHFLRRERPVNRNPYTGEPVQWPTRSMLQRIQSLGFHLIPSGCESKREGNPFRHLEWRIVFPKAEWYLQRNLTSAQLKVFIICQALVKSFVEPEANEISELMLTTAFLRTHLFWECERNGHAWPEEFLGEALLRFLKTFLLCLREKSLNDFFVEERNLFETISDFALQRLNQILSEVVENPLMHLLVALRNLHYADHFYPKQSFHRLYSNLIEDDVMKLRAMSKNTRHSLTPRMNATAANPISFEALKCLQGLEVDRESRRYGEKTKPKLRRRTQALRHNIELAKQVQMAKAQGSTESIDVEFFFGKGVNYEPGTKNTTKGIENLRRTNVLEILLDHLLATAKRAIELRSLKVATMLLNQADRLCKFYGDYGCDLGEKAYRNSLKSMQKDMAVMKQTDRKLSPALPLRTSTADSPKSNRHKITPIRDSRELISETDNTGVSNKHTFQIVKGQKNQDESSESSSDEGGSSTSMANKVNIIMAEVHVSDPRDLVHEKPTRGYSPVLITSNANVLARNRMQEGGVMFSETSFGGTPPQNKEDEVILSQRLEETILDFQDFQEKPKVFCQVENVLNDFQYQDRDESNTKTCNSGDDAASPTSSIKFLKQELVLANKLKAIKKFISADTLFSASSVKNLLPSRVLAEKRIQEVYELVKMKTIQLKDMLKDT